MLAGSTTDGSRILHDYVRAGRGSPEATVLAPEAFPASAAAAALANGASGHALDFDDTQLSTSPDRIFGLLTHPTIPPLAAALAVGERGRISGTQFLEAFLIGFEVECKIAEAIDPNHYKKGFHSSGTIGAFGAMAAAARLLGPQCGNHSPCAGDRRKPILGHSGELWNDDQAASRGTGRRKRGNGRGVGRQRVYRRAGQSRWSMGLLRDLQLR